VEFLELNVGFLTFDARFAGSKQMSRIISIMIDGCMLATTERGVRFFAGCWRCRAGCWRSYSESTFCWQSCWLLANPLLAAYECERSKISPTIVFHLSASVPLPPVAFHLLAG
jgi:hypothetical protein